MAEQVSHNVVNVPESASGSSPLVDVVANHTSTSSAESGNTLPTAIPTKPTDASDPQNDLTADAIAPNTTSVDAGQAAAEPSAGDAVATPDNIPAIAQPLKTDDQSKAGQTSTVNGTLDSASQGSALEDGGSQDNSAVNSDTDMSKGDVSEAKDGHLHVRTNSVKKPTTFSKISVTKNFLAKSNSAAPTAAKTGERASPVSSVAPPVAKPRLIAKTGASLRELQKARQNAESPSGPDASKVWNKNRPTAPPPPKQFTDEELKQQYGIHLATRLQSDENGKESKWADIDEDEDDWVPDAVTWIDGTKSALTPADNTPASKETKPAEPTSAKPAEEPKPSLTAMKKPAEPSGPPKTILKPGAAAQAKQNGLANQSSSAPEKATLKAKSPAPPSKSPWATLPPVDKVSPVNPPVQSTQQQTPFVSQDARAYDSMPPHQPMREIAADTFDRSWREGEGGRRELFNSVSGHYEPVAEGRRGSRPDPFGRKPAVLQRPSQTGMDIHAPEPSPAFQTRSGSQTDGPPPWARRRGSSVSQGSMAPRRMSMNRSQEPFAPQERRMSTVAGHNMRASPTLSKTDGHPSMFSQQNAWQQQMPPPPAPGAGEELEDPFKAQERIMKEKRELALKRKVDEEEQQRQAASKERLQAKMAALQNAGQSRQEREAAAKEAAASAPKPVVEPTPEDLKPADNLAVKAVHPQEFSPAPVVQALESKVAHSLPNGSQSAQAKASPPADADLPHPISKPDGPDVPTRSVSDQTQRQAPRGPLSPKANNARAPFQQATSSPYRAPNSAFSSPGERKQQPFGRSPMVGGDGFSPWPSAGSGNVWGTAGIGNGVFESASSFAPMPMMSQQSSTLPPPPGMSRPGAQARITPPQALASESRSPSLAAAQAAEQGRAFAPPGMEGRPDHFTSQSRPTGASPTSSLSRPQRVPGPIAPPSRAQPPLQNQPAEDSRLAAWRSASQTLPAQYASNAKANGSTSHNEPPSVENGDIYRETFRQTSRGRLGGPRKIERSEYTVHDAQGSHLISSITPAPPSTQTQPAVPVPTSSPLSHLWKQAAGNTVRLPNGSTNPAHGGAAAPQPPIGAPYARAQPAPVGTPRRAKAPADPLPPTVDSKEQPPPPPETATHPVYSGDAKQPHVRLPKSRPVVRLPPPSATAPPQPSVMMPPRQHWGPPGGRPIVQNEAWQARFNGLFNRANITTETPPSPPKTPPKAYDPAFHVASSSRIAMHDPPTSTSATVSLPQMQQPTRRTTVEGFLLDDSSDVTSKDTIEQMFNEELSFGSKPLTRVPRTVVYPEIGADAVHNMLTLRPEAFPKPSEAQSKAPFDMISLHFRNPKGCFVKMPGVKTKHNPIFWRRTGLNKGTHKPKTKTVAAKETGVITPNSTVPNSASNAGSRKASSQKVSAASTPQQKSPTPGATDNAASAGSKRGFSFKAAKGRGPNASVKSTTN